MGLLDEKKLHTNFLKLHAFVDPTRRLNDKNNPCGKYHNDFNWIFTVVEKIESLSTKSRPVDIIIANGIVKVKVYESSILSNRYHYHNDIVYVDEYMSKLIALYRACVDFVTWFNQADCFSIIERFYTSPYSKEYRVSSGTDRMFPDKVSIDYLIHVAAEAFSVTALQMGSKTRKQEVVKARQTCMLLLNFDGLSLSAAGEVFMKDHATVLHAKKAILDIIETKDPEYYTSVMKVLHNFNLKEKFEK